MCPCRTVFFSSLQATGRGRGSGVVLAATAAAVILSAFYHKPNLTTKARSQQCYVLLLHFYRQNEQLFVAYESPFCVLSSIRMNKIGFGIAF